MGKRGISTGSRGSAAFQSATKTATEAGLQGDKMNKLRINQKDYPIEVRPEEKLLGVLRQLGFLGAKSGGCVKRNAALARF